MIKKRIYLKLEQEEQQREELKIDKSQLVRQEQTNDENLPVVLAVIFSKVRCNISN